ncbi:MAG: DUF5996 family protein [Thermoleophilia bacterium]
MTQDAWPALPYREWAPTKKTLHMCAQMIGKARLAMAPPQPEWLHTCLYLDPRGFSTGAMPQGTRIVTMGIDVFESTLWLRTSDGGTQTLPLGPERCVAEIWADFCAASRKLGLELDLWEKPQEMADVTLFSENTHDCRLDPEHARRFHRLLSSVNGAFEEFRSPFFGRSGVQFWWGTFDLAVLLFTGKQVPAPEDLGYIMRYDLDAQHMNAGFWPGDDDNPQAAFYAYLVPRPPGCELAAIEPEHGNWVEAMGEWILPYDKVQISEDPRTQVLTFLESVYQYATSAGGWDGEAHRYTRPGPARRS